MDTRNADVIDGNTWKKINRTPACIFLFSANVKPMSYKNNVISRCCNAETENDENPTKLLSFQMSMEHTRGHL